MTQLQVIARHTIKIGHEDEVFDLLPKLVDAVRTEPGNLAFAVYRRLDDERSYVLLERYRSREDFADHQRTPHFKEFILDQIVPRLETRVIECYDVVES